jgi:hypothetical protein
MLAIKLLVAGFLSFWWSSVVVRYVQMEEWAYINIALVSIIGGGLIGFIIGIFI